VIFLLKPRVVLQYGRQASEGACQQNELSGLLSRCTMSSESKDETRLRLRTIHRRQPVFLPRRRCPMPAPSEGSGPRCLSCAIYPGRTRLPGALASQTLTALQVTLSAGLHLSRVVYNRLRLNERP
jgi:hypothetical protein